MGGVVTGIHTFRDPFDHRVGILVCPDIDHHIDRFEAGFFVNVIFTISKLMTQGDDVVFRLFLTNLLPSENYFTPTAWRCQDQKPSIDISDESMREVLIWHFKHCLILSWGGFSLTSYLRTFLTPDGNMVAWSLDLEDCYSENSSPASSAFDFLWSSGDLTD